MPASGNTTAARRVLLCVCGGIAAYKSAELVRRLRAAGCEVQVAMTDNAQRFVGAQTFQALSHRPVRNSLWDEHAEAAMGHLELARWAQQVVVAPATANTIARLAHGMADDLVSTLCLATEAPIAIAPAMNHVMWKHPARGAADRPERRPAGRGRIRARADGGTARDRRRAGSRRMSASLAGRRLLVSAGPTYEDIDPVRFLGNRSSGKMGFAVAAVAAERGAEVTLVAGPVYLPTPEGVRRLDVRSAAQMFAAVMDQLADGQPPCDAYIGAAAVADFTPRSFADNKLKKTPGQDTLVLELVKTRDILAEVAAHARRPGLVVGFAAETNDLPTYARDKLERKRLDLICANRVGVGATGFESDDNALLVLGREGLERALGPASKTELAASLLDLIAERLR